MASVSELLCNTLDDLVKDHLKRFRSLLKDDKKIRAGKLENADVTDIVRLMRESYGDEEAVKITLNILRKMNQNQLAEDLQKDSEVQKSLDAAEKHTEKQGFLASLIPAGSTQLICAHADSAHLSVNPAQLSFVSQLLIPSIEEVPLSLALPLPLSPLAPEDTSACPQHAIILSVGRYPFSTFSL
ncbi:hypothetical protein Q8A67_016040 [Cirrhinus molitorella]|uniref:Pyrin domain-containing protein n=1 Tax=Cirrhinus molitorella TaxID=172907 RepID=A0AA88TTZ4_9TELE|nr:hypothetical protein Q8A67_016040 [Cirrhinus molitorella]